MKTYEIDSNEYEEVEHKIDELNDLIYNFVVFLNEDQSEQYKKITELIDSNKPLTQFDIDYIKKLFTLHKMAW